MPIPTEGLGEKRYRAGQAKQTREAAADIAATAEKLDVALTPQARLSKNAALADKIVAETLGLPVDAQQVDVDSAFEAEFAALEAEEAAKDAPVSIFANPINLIDPHNAAPTHARTTIVNGQKVIDMGSIKITATPEKIEVQRAAPQVIVDDGRPPRALSQKTLDEMAAGRATLERHQSAVTARSLQPERSEPGGVADGRTVSRSREEVWLAAGLTSAEIATLKAHA